MDCSKEVHETLATSEGCLVGGPRCCLKERTQYFYNTYISKVQVLVLSLRSLLNYYYCCCYGALYQASATYPLCFLGPISPSQNEHTDPRGISQEGGRQRPALRKVPWQGQPRPRKRPTRRPWLGDGLLGLKTLYRRWFGIRRPKSLSW